MPSPASGSQQRVLVTGADGFVGGWLLRELAERRKEAAGLDVFAAGHGPEAEYRLDIRDAAAVAALVGRLRPTAVIHLAAVAAPAEARQAPRMAWEVNFTGTMNLAYAVKEHAPEACFVFAGSSEAYGAAFNAAAPEPIAETAALQPTTVYGATKAAADILLAQMACEGLRAIRFRPFNHTGPGQRETYVISAFARQIAVIALGRRPPVVSVGNLDVRRDFLDVRDVVRAYADAALSGPPEAWGRPFNLASGEANRIGDLLDRLIRLSGREIEVRVDPALQRPADVGFAAGNAQAAAQAFGWRPRIPLDRTLADVLDRWKAELDRPTSP